MRKVKARFVVSAMRPEDFPRDRKPEIAFAGRSNVGKSSLLNAMVGRKGLAKTSKTPGKTRTINFFEIDGRFYFVDLPGYGFAKAPRRLKQQWGDLIPQYLKTRADLRMVVHLIDARHPPMPNDYELLDLLGTIRIPVLLVATKSDKLKPSQRNGSLQRIRQDLELDDDALVVLFSSVTGEGARAVWDVLRERIEGAGGRQ